MSDRAEPPSRTEQDRAEPPFVARFPALFHVTRASAVPSIRRFGLLPASTLAGEAIAFAHRTTWTRCTAPDGGVAWLRWQRLSDTVLSTRLPPDASPFSWRRVINGMTFLFGTLDEALALAASPADQAIDQVVLRFETRALLASGCTLLCCRWNNGFPDRGRPPRIRTAADYRPVSAWRRGDPVREITIKGSVAPTVPFEMLPTRGR